MGLKIYDIEDLTPEQQQAYGIIQAQQEQSGLINDSSGLMNTQPLSTNFGFIRAPVETIIQGQVEGNAQIVIGKDRPGMIMGPGYGAIGAQGADSIDIVVGRGSSFNGGRGPAEGKVLNPNFNADAARIHISQMTDIDTNFGLAAGRDLTGNRSKGKSGIGIKADGVRIIGREGVKIVTGPSYASGPAEVNSRGESLEGKNPKIELIAGNGPLVGAGIGLQGITKGKNLEACLLTLVDHINKIIDRIIQLAMLQNAMNSVMGANIWHPHYAGAASFTFSQISDTIIVPLQALRLELTNYFPAEYLESGSDKYITSTNVFST